MSACQPKAATTIPSPRRSLSSGRVIGGHIEGWGGQDVRLLDLFYKGGETIRGFNRSGFGPRDLIDGRRAGRFDVLGGDGGASLPVAADTGRPRHQRRRLRGCRFAVRGAGAGAIAAARSRSREGGCLVCTTSRCPPSVGASILWNSPLGPAPRRLRPRRSPRSSTTRNSSFRFGASTKF